MRVLNEFLQTPTKRFQLRELSRLTKLSTTAVKRLLVALVDEELIKETHEKNYYFFEANRGNERYKLVKKLVLIYSLESDGVLTCLCRALNHPEAVILFGSASHGEDTENSDIDLFVLSEVKRHLSLKAFEKALKRRINVLIMNKKEFEAAKSKNPELVNNLVNGILLRGYLEVV